MKVKKLLKILTLIAICVVFVGVLMVTSFAATTQTNVEIYKKNIIFGEKLQLMFAIDAPEYVDVSAVCGDDRIDIEYIGNDTIDGRECLIYRTKDGWAPQNINATVTVTATANGQKDVLTYSVLMYLYERLHLDNLDPVAEADRIAMYEALLAYAKATDKVVNSQDGRTPHNFDSYHYVSVVNGTLDGYNDWGMYKEGETPFANIEHALDLTQNEIVEWTYTLNGESMGYIDIDDLKALSVTGAITVTAVPTVKGAHTDHSAYKPVSNAEELNDAFTNGGKYYLTADVEVAATVTTSASVELCLNGHIVSAAESEEGFSIFNVTNEGKLFLVDCDTTERAGYIENNKWIEGTKDGADSVVLTGGYIAGGNSYRGGAVYSVGTLEIYNVDFVNNSAKGTDSMGGAIYSGHDGHLSISGANFVANSAEYQGGAVYVTNNADVYAVSDSKFIGNFVTNSSYGGGAIYNTGTNGEYVRVTFIDNYSCKGGAVALHSGSSITVKSMLAENNRAVIYTSFDEETQTEKHTLGIGGVFYINSSDLTLSESNDEIVFKNNSAQSGGAIYSEINRIIPNIEISGADFIGNSANLGGAIYSNSSKITIHGGSFSENKALTSHGGAIYAATGGVKNGEEIEYVITELVIDDNCIFTENVSADHGGAVYLTHSSKIGSTLKMTGGSFIGNAAVFGGAISVRTGAEATLIGTDFTNNTAIELADTEVSSSAGGAIYGGYATVNINGGTLTNNNARNGGAIYLVGDANTAMNISIDGATLTGNVSTTNGGALYITGTVNAEIQNSTFGDSENLGNKAPYGGAIFAKGNITLNIAGSSFENNSATKQGGALRCESITDLNIVDSKFVSNTSANEGGAIYLNSCNSYQITNTEFINNSATWCKRGGGAIYTTAAIGTLNDVTFTGNSSAKGGAVALHTSSVLDVNNITASNNYASAYECTCTDGSNCSFGIGGVFYVGWSELNINGKANIDNSNAVNGGAIYNDGGSITLNGTEFSSNVATHSGGAIYSAGGKITANGGSFTSNKSLHSSASDKSGGGAIIITGNTTMSLNGVTMTSNSAGYYGGTIAAYDSKLTIGADNNGNKSAIIGSQGKTGSAICFKDFDKKSSTGTYVINGLDVKDTVGKGSGVIYCNDGSLTINDLTASNNSSSSGGIIHISGGQSFEIKNSSFELTDTAGAPSGAINFTVSNKKLTLENITLTGSKAVINATSKAVVEIRHKTEEEKAAMTEAVILSGGSTITYVDISAEQ